MDIDRLAPAITDDEIVIKASLDTVWNLFTDISGWSEWNKDITYSKLNGTLAIGESFSWTTYGMNINSTINELIPKKEIGWSGLVMDIMGIHVWTFEETGNGVLVKTHESWSGKSVEAQKEQMQEGLDKSLRSWLEDLKTKAESLA